MAGVGVSVFGPSVAVWLVAVGVFVLSVVVVGGLLYLLTRVDGGGSDFVGVGVMTAMWCVFAGWMTVSIVNSDFRGVEDFEGSVVSEYGLSSLVFGEGSVEGVVKDCFGGQVWVEDVFFSFVEDGGEVFRGVLKCDFVEDEGMMWVVLYGVVGDDLVLVDGGRAELLGG